jgi:hypothetical protein
VDSWYDTIRLFYKLQNLLTRFAVHKRWRPSIIRALQGAPYTPERVASNRALQGAMESAYEQVIADPHSLLRPWAMDPEKDHTLTCPTCLGVADYWKDKQAFVCRRCGASLPAAGFQFLSEASPRDGAEGPAG